MNQNALSAIILFGVLSCTGDEPNTSEQVPLPPTNLLAVTASETQINLSWTDNSTNETGFKIERKNDVGSYTEVATVGTDLTTYNDTGLTPNTTYTYRLYSFNDGGKSVTYSNESSAKTFGVPILSTSPITLVTYSSALSGGSINFDGGSTVSTKGIVWDTNTSPTISLTTKTNEGTGLEGFTSELTKLSPNTKYYVRAYAINDYGVGYGDELSFTTTSASDQEIQLNKLKANTWNITSASLGTTDRISDFTNLKLTISGNFVAGGTYDFSFTGTRPNPSPWPASGTWKFGANAITQLIRLTDDPDIGMNYTLTDTQLTISFTYTGAGYAGGRIEQVEGDWEFVFMK